MPLRHPFGPLWKADSQILILGTFPSVKSRETAFFTAIRKTASGASSRPSLRKPSPFPLRKRRNFYSVTASRSGTWPGAVK
jgi:hypothetical protein